MIKVVNKYKSINLDETIKQKKEVYNESVTTDIVASTKSFNNLMDDYKIKNQHAYSTSTEDIFLDKAVAKVKLAELIAVTHEKLDSVIVRDVIEHCISALDGACVFFKPPVVRKK